MRKLLFLIFCASLAHAITFDQAANEIVDAGKFLNQANLCPATTGNLSIKLDSDLIAITVSGRHKGELTPEDVMLVDSEGKSLTPSKKPSAETLLHTMIYQVVENAGAVLHHHTADGTVLSRILPDTFKTEGYEIHKVFPNIKTHDSEVVIPIFENSQDYPTLANEIAEYLKAHPQTYGFLLRGHGFTTWGRDMKETRMRVEAFEYLFECELKTRGQ